MSNSQLRPRRNLHNRRNSEVRLIAAAAVVILALGSVAFLNRSVVRGIYEQVTGAEYSGEGSAVVQVKIARGDVGMDVAKELVEEGVTKNYNITLRIIYAENPTFFPGTYMLPTKISTSKAISYLVDSGNAVTNRVTVREGLRKNDVFKLLSASTGKSVESFVAASKDLESYDLPSQAPSIEGYLFPATYELDPALEAHEILSVLVERTKEQLAQDGVDKNDWHKVLTLASVIQREARQEQDFYKVSAVFTNRLKIGMALQSDATVSYGVGGNTFQTSAADRADPNPYNTYKYSGLPVGPISGAGALAIDAALNPVAGSWLYFVSVNLETGETVFSDTYAQHGAAVTIWRNWLRENPGWND